MPPCLKPLDGFVIATGDSQFYEIEKSFVPKLVNTLPGNENTTTLGAEVQKAEIISGDAVMVTDSTYQFQVYTGGDMPKNAFFTLTVPLSVKLPENPATMIKLNCMIGCSSKSPTIAWSATDRVLTFKGVVPDVSSYISAPGPIQFTVKGFTNPSTTDRAYFVWTSYASFADGDFMIDRISNLWVQSKQGTCEVTQFYPTDNNYQIFGVAQSWQVALKCEYAITTGLGVQITLPQGFSLTQKSDCKVYPQTKDTSCRTNQSERTLNVFGIVNQTISQNSEFSFQVDSIRNPAVGDQDFLVEVAIVTPRDFAKVSIGNFTVSGDKLTAGRVLQFTVVPFSLVVGQSPVFYDFLVQPSGHVLKGSYLVISLPTQIKLNDVAKLEEQCSYNMTGFTNKQLACSVNANQIFIRNGFLTADTTQSSIEQTPLLKFSLPQFVNPASMSPTSAFDVKIVGEDGKLLYDWQQSVLTVNGQPMQGIREGPLVQMTVPSSPRSFKLVRDSYVNGAITTYTFTVEPNVFISDGDIIQITVPDPVRMTTRSYVMGVSDNLKRNQTYQLSEDLSLIQITVSLQQNQGRRLARTDQAFIFAITGVKNPISLESTLGSVEYSVFSGLSLIEQKLGGNRIKNTQAGELLALQQSIIPEITDNLAPTNYTLTITPVNFEQGMSILVTVPRGIEFGPGTFRCIGLRGTDSPLVSCNYNTLTREINITSPVTSQEYNPGQIKVAFDSLINPPSTVTQTGSFVVQTFTKRGFMLDEISRGLTINFFCELPCATCDQVNKTVCNSCYFGDRLQIWLEHDCVEGCPIGQISTTSNNCTQCQSPCTSCVNNAYTCTGCIEGFIQYKDTCVEIVYWPFPFVILAIVSAIVFMISECRTQGRSKFKEAFTAWLSLAEVGSWLTFCVFSAFKVGFEVSSLTSIFAVIGCLILNISHAVIHTREIIPQAPRNYQRLLANYKYHTNFVRFISYTVSFKFSQILLSDFCLMPRFAGRYNHQTNKLFNIHVLSHILVPTPLMLASVVYYLMNHGFFSYPGFVAIEVIAVTALSSSLILPEALSACSCAKRPVKVDSGAKADNKIFDAGIDYESEDADEGKKILKRKGRAEVDEFGDSRSHLNPYTTNQSLQLSLDDKNQLKEIQDLMCQLHDERQKVLAPVDNSELIKFVNDKIGQSDALNRQILREIYEDQLQQMKMQQKRGYRNVEIEMENGPPLSIRSNSDVSIRNVSTPQAPPQVEQDFEALKETVNLPKPEFGLIQSNLHRTGQDDSIIQEFDDGSNGGERFLKQLTPKKGEASFEENIVFEDELMMNEKGEPVYQIEDQIHNKALSEQYYNAPETPRVAQSEQNFADNSDRTVQVLEKPEPSFENTIGLKLVDLGLGDQFDSNNEKKIIQKRAVDWYMQRTPELGKSPLTSSRPSERRSKHKSPPISTRAKSNQPPESLNRNQSRRAFEIVQDEFGHSESSEGIVNHEVFNAQSQVILGDITREPRREAPTRIFYSQPLLEKLELPSEPLTQKMQPLQSAAFLKPVGSMHEILYSDRSESSIEQLMDDTPSNYNEMNGRLHGRSLGILAMQQRVNAKNSLQGARHSVPVVGDEADSSASTKRKKAVRTNKSFNEPDHQMPIDTVIARNDNYV